MSDVSAAWAAAENNIAEFAQPLTEKGILCCVAAAWQQQQQHSLESSGGSVVVDVVAAAAAAAQTAAATAEMSCQYAQGSTRLRQTLV